MPYIQNNIEEALGLVIKYASIAERKGASIVCFPESFLQGYEVSDKTPEVGLSLSSSVFNSLLKKLEEISVTLVIGLIETDEGSTFNTAVVVEKGVLKGKYRKNKLIGKENDVFKAGNDFPVFELEGIKYGINICYDLNFSECAKAISEQGASILVCPCNNMLTFQNAEKWKNKHNPARAERSKETGLWLISSDVTGKTEKKIGYGPTAIIDPNGNVVEQLPLMEPGVLTYEIKLS